MFNVLPENIKREIKSNYRMRLIVVCLLIIIVVQVSALVFMLPSWVSSYYRQKDVANRAEKMNQNLPAIDMTAIDSEIKSTNFKLKILTSTLEYPEIIPYINLILENKTNSIKLNSLTYTLPNQSSAKFNLNGVADSRDALLAFVKNIQNTGKFKAVDLPISNFAKDKNIRFSLDLTINS